MLFNCESLLQGNSPIAISAYVVCRATEPVVIVAGAATVALLAYACFAHEKIKKLQMTNVKKSCITRADMEAANAQANVAGMIGVGIALTRVARVFYS